MNRLWGSFEFTREEYDLFKYFHPSVQETQDSLALDANEDDMVSGPYTSSNRILQLIYGIHVGWPGLAEKMLHTKPGQRYLEEMGYQS